MSKIKPLRKTQNPSPEQLQEYLQLTRLAEMGRLAASVAHEINNPLMIAQGFAENLEMLLSHAENTPMQKEDMRLQVLEIIKACQRMGRIVAKMNRLSRGQKLRMHVVDLAEVALNAVDFLKVQVADLDIQLEFDFTQPMPVDCDVVQIEQTVLNILSNAIYALQAQDGPRRIRVSFEEVGREWQQIKIWNNGPVIPTDIQAQIIKPFFTTKPEGMNSGLGLSVSKAIMEVHGGDLTFHSSSELGTEFILSFPRPSQNPWLKHQKQNAGTIFIMDRHQNYRRTLQEKFRLLGFKVEAFADYDEGLSVIKKCNDVAAVLVDIVPGQLDSVALVRRIRNLIGPSGLLYTVTSFPSARDYRPEFRKAGASECFEKPLLADNFTHIVKQLDSLQNTPAAAANKLAA